MSVSHNTSTKERLVIDNKYQEKLDITKLALCWALTLTTSTLLTVRINSFFLFCSSLYFLLIFFLKTIGPLAAKDIGASDSLAPFTIGTFLIGAAVSSVPSGKLFNKYGRYWGFAWGCICQIIGSALGSFAMMAENLPLVFIGCFFVGLGQGLGQFYRFAAVEVASEENKSKAVTYVLTGGVLAAFLGPSSANVTKGIVSHRYFGSFASMGIIGLMNWGVVALINFVPPGDITAALTLQKRRPLKEICTTPIFIMSCTIATIAHTVMVSALCLSCACSLIDSFFLHR